MARIHSVKYIFLEKNTLDVDDFVRVFSLRTSLRGEDPLGQIHYFGEKYP